MQGPWPTLGLAIVLFASTNVDDIFVLVAFFSDRRFRPRDIVAGQFVGMGLLVAISGIGSMLAVLVSPRYVGLLGVFPILLGVVQLFRRGGPSESEEHPSRPARGGFGRVLTVALVTVANGGDNIGVYVPVFATRTRAELAAMMVVFVGLTAVWCAAGYHLVNHPRFGQPLRRHAGRITPFVFIALGLLILFNSQAYRLLGL